MIEIKKTIYGDYHLERHTDLINEKTGQEIVEEINDIDEQELFELGESIKEKLSTK